MPNRRHQMPKGLLVAAVFVAIVSMPAHGATASTSVPCPNTFHSPSGIADGSPTAKDVTLRNVRNVVAARAASLRERLSAERVAVGRYVGSVRDGSGTPQSVTAATHYAIDLTVPALACPSMPSFEYGVPLYFYVTAGKATTARHVGRYIGHRLRDARFSAVRHGDTVSVESGDPTSGASFVVAQEPPPGTVHSGIAPAVGLRTASLTKSFCREVRTISLGTRLGTDAKRYRASLRRARPRFDKTAPLRSLFGDSFGRQPEGGGSRCDCYPWMCRIGLAVGLRPQAALQAGSPRPLGGASHGHESLEFSIVIQPIPTRPIAPNQHNGARAAFAPNLWVRNARVRSSLPAHIRRGFPDSPAPHALVERLDFVEIGASHPEGPFRRHNVLY